MCRLKSFIYASLRKKELIFAWAKRLQRVQIEGSTARTEFLEQGNYLVYSSPYNIPRQLLKEIQEFFKKKLYCNKPTTIARQVKKKSLVKGQL